MPDVSGGGGRAAAGAGAAAAAGDIPAPAIMPESMLPTTASLLRGGAAAAAVAVGAMPALDIMPESMLPTTASLVTVPCKWVTEQLFALGITHKRLLARAHVANHGILTDHALRAGVKNEMSALDLNRSSTLNRNHTLNTHQAFHP